LLLSLKYKQLTNQLQFDYDSSLTMNRRDNTILIDKNKGDETSVPTYRPIGLANTL